MENILISVISAGIPALVTIITHFTSKKDNNMHAAKQSIFQMIMEDKIRVLNNSIPENYQAIHKEFDEYVKNGGNSYVHEKVNDYDKWYNDVKRCLQINK